MSTLYFLSPTDTAASGGIKQLYRQADILNRNGFDAAVVHRERGFRHTWFSNKTRIVHGDDLKLTPDDYVVMPEVFSPQPFAKGIRKVVFNQNCYRSFMHYGSGEDLSGIPYLDPEVVATIVVSEDSRSYLEHAFPKMPIHRVSYGIDPELFRPQPAKKRQIAFMPRRLPEDIAQVVSILVLRGALKDVELAPIDDMTEEQVAAVMRDSLLFLGFSHREGFGLPPAEAMACGCIVVGYAGGAGKEFLLPELSYPVPEGDIQRFAMTVEEILAQHAENPAAFAEKAGRASEFVLGKYSLAAEEASCVAAWRGITGRR